MNSLDFHSVLPNPSCSWSFSGSTKSPNYLQGKHLGPQSLVLQRRWPAALLQRPSVPVVFLDFPGIPAGAIEKLMAKRRNRTSQNFTCLKWRFRHCLMGWVERGDPQSCLARHLQLLPRKYQSFALSTSSTNSRFRWQKLQSPQTWHFVCICFILYIYIYRYTNFPVSFRKISHRVNLPILGRAPSISIDNAAYAAATYTSSAWLVGAFGTSELIVGFRELIPKNGESSLFQRTFLLMKLFWSQSMRVFWWLFEQFMP